MIDSVVNIPKDGGITRDTCSNNNNNNKKTVLCRALNTDEYLTDSCVIKLNMQHIQLQWHCTDFDAPLSNIFVCAKPLCLKVPTRVMV